ncbi:MAG: DUF72 domain-containing protein [Aigarchaeota archaeon]|nr:DUF72 domain-containing protein [Aigarchaeota archaeon]MDW8092257.1 DUF72 domain-containing protein [Nitrososphaerota archaeon]
MRSVLIGCCGFPVPKRIYLEDFNLVELQYTFYKLPRTSTVKKWREEVPRDFTFTVKAFQGITHPPSSPTWRRSNVKPNSRYGNLQPTEEVFRSWSSTLEICRILDAPICVIQTPYSFEENERNVKNIKEFFRTVELDDLKIAFEFRGWSRDTVRDLCSRLNLIHVVDPFVSTPSWTLNGEIAYFRLHGSPPGPHPYVYRYTNADLLRLLDLVINTEARIVYVLFNNVGMFEDARRFKKLLSRRLRTTKSPTGDRSSSSLGS